MTHYTHNTKANQHWFREYQETPLFCSSCLVCLFLLFVVFVLISQDTFICNIRVQASRLLAYGQTSPVSGCLENDDLENDDLLENNDLENDDLENDDLENDDLENDDLENDDLENNDLEKD